jgi:chromosome segregation ATPase
MTSQATDTPEAASEVTDLEAAIPYAAEAKNTEADVLDKVGNALLGLVNRAARTTAADLQAAREVAEKLADQLRAAQNRINELEANVRYYQDRTERAEKWMHQISSEIHQRFLGADDSDGARRMVERLQNQDKNRAMPRPPDDSDVARRMAEQLQNQDKNRAMRRPSRREPATPTFLRRLAKH